MTLNVTLEKRQQGLSIVELMIALLLGSLLVGGLVQILTSNSQAFRMAEATARTQEFGRIASEMISREARGAGYFGCNSDQMVNNLDVDPDDDDYNWDPGVGISSENSLRPAAAISGTDFIFFSGLDGGGLEISASSPPTSASTKVRSRGGANPNSFLSDGDVIAIADCQGVDIVQITNISGGGDDSEVTLVTNSGSGESPGNDFTNNTCSNTGNGGAGNNCLSNDYGIGAQIFKPYDRTYYIGTSATTGEPALMMLELSNGALQAHEMVEGVVDMQVRYGLSVDKFQAVDRWEDATAMAASDWEQIRAVRVSLLVRGGSDNVFEDPASLCYPAWTDCTSGNNYTAPEGDSHMYRAYEFTTNVRNKSN
ncbi:PilW family protein [Marinobacter sp. F3R08]|uniref:PilW family protein n=1 Tax=Marinobacter sp. F3R08 TaxID=2841559 RepID=UPI001C08A0FE|nr:PilW family protein [Marinobacter sp. F3R08]MBU2952352.1 PilW family protein [Marinobacter sp. F3R08]